MILLERKCQLRFFLYSQNKLQGNYPLNMPDPAVEATFCWISHSRRKITFSWILGTKNYGNKTILLFLKKAEVVEDFPFNPEHEGGQKNRWTYSALILSVCSSHNSFFFKIGIPYFHHGVSPRDIKLHTFMTTTTLTLELKVKIIGF